MIIVHEKQVIKEYEKLLYTLNLLSFKQVFHSFSCKSVFRFSSFDLLEWQHKILLYYLGWLHYYICTIIYSLKICVPLSYFFVSIIKAMSVTKVFYFIFPIIYSTYIPSSMFVCYSLPSLHLMISLISEEFFRL